jgi:hypothetical protein
MPGFGTETVRILNPVAWPGDTIRFTSAAFLGLDSLAEVRLDGVLLAASRIDDSTLAFRAPEVSGTFRLTLRLGNETRLGTIRLAGLLSSAPTLSHVRGWPTPAAYGSPIMFVAGDAEVLRLDVRTGSAQPLGVTHASGCAVSPGYSYRPAALVTQGIEPAPAYPNSCGRAHSWTLAPATGQSDSAPFGQNGTARYWAELAPGSWLLASNHYIDLYRGVSVVWSERLEDTEQFLPSPDLGLAFPTTVLSSAGIPVLDLATATIRYRTPLARSHAAAWSADGDTLFVIGSEYADYETQRLYAFDASTGSPLGTPGPLVPGDAWDVALDQSNSLAYAAVLGSQLGLVVLNRATRQVVGQVPFDNGIFCPAGCQVKIAIDAAAQRLYLLVITAWTFPGQTGRIFTFEMPPYLQTPQEMGH